MSRHDWTPEVREEFFTRLKIRLGADGTEPVDDSLVSDTLAKLIETTTVAWAEMAADPCDCPPVHCGLAKAQLMVETLLLIPALTAQREVTGHTDFLVASTLARETAQQMLTAAQAALGLPIPKEP